MEIQLKPLKSKQNKKFILSRKGISRISEILKIQESLSSSKIEINLAVTLHNDH